MCLQREGTGDAVRSRRVSPTTNDWEQVQANLRAVATNEPVTSHVAVAGEFRVGQQVQINNNINHVRFRRITTKDIFRVVARLSMDQIGNPRVWITTYRGYSTWRHPNNLQHITSREQSELALENVT